MRSAGQATESANAAIAGAHSVRLRVELEAVLADVDDAVDADHAPRVRSGPAADRGDERVAGREPLERARASPSGTTASSGRSTIGASVAVDVEQDRRLAGGSAASAQ